MFSLEKYARLARRSQIPILDAFETSDGKLYQTNSNEAKKGISVRLGRF